MGARCLSGLQNSPLLKPSRDFRPLQTEKAPVLAAHAAADRLVLAFPCPAWFQWLWAPGQHKQPLAGKHGSPTACREARPVASLLLGPSVARWGCLPMLAASTGHCQGCNRWAISL